MEHGPQLPITRRRRPESPVRITVVTSAGAGEEGGIFGSPGRSGGGGLRARLRLWVQVFCWALGVALALPFMGLIGYRLGFAEVLGLTELKREAGACLADGVRMAAYAPIRLFDAGLRDAADWSFAMTFLVAGVAVLAVAVFAREIGSETKPGAVVSANVFGSVVGIAATLAILVWTLYRGRMVAADPLPWADPTALPIWMARLRVTAGLDVIVLAAALIWFIFALRLRGWRWLRSLTIVSAGVTLGTTLVASSISGGILAHMDMPRPVVRTDDSELDPELNQHLIIGHTPSHVVSVGRDRQIRLQSPAETSTIMIRRSNLTDFLRESPLPVETTEPAAEDESSDSG